MISSSEVPQYLYIDIVKSIFLIVDTEKQQDFSKVYDMRKLSQVAFILLKIMDQL